MVSMDGDPYSSIVFHYLSQFAEELLSDNYRDTPCTRKSPSPKMQVPKSIPISNAMSLQKPFFSPLDLFFLMFLKFKFN